MKGRLLIRDVCLADGYSATLQVGVSVLIENGRIAWVSPDESDPGDTAVLDGGGATIVPAFVDSHSHLTMPGGSHWIDRGSDPPDQLREVARRNAARLVQAGILWARDVGSPAGPDGRAVSLLVRQEMANRTGAPYIRVAGTWIATDGYLPMTVPVKDGDELRAAVLAQLDSGTDFVKIMLDPPDRSDRCPFTVEDVRKACEAVHARGRKITAHATILDGARVGAEAGVDSIEHGMELDDTIAATMRAKNVALVSTLSVLASWATFERTTRIERFTSDEGKRRLTARREGAFAAIKAAHRAGVRIAGGSDFGGGSVRAGHLAWEVEKLVEAGLEPHEALAAVTWRGGELLGVDHAGRIRAGDPADLVLVHGDPLSDPRALWRV
ncbi:MAG: amidohydrolase family protein, partial [Candidatus Dormibacteraeota bacterium]|nr:amidohydrolase family protein [Candidatus Dormibacteraeota bacterium]